MFKRSKKQSLFRPAGFWDIRAHWTFVTVFLFSVLALLVVWLYAEILTPQSNFDVTKFVATNLRITDPDKAQNNNIRLIATGDAIPHDALNLRAKTDNGYDYLQFMDRMQTYFAASDINFCNQAVLGAGEDFGISGYPNFNSPVEFAQDLNKVGCNLINTGSNHTNDFNQDVIDASVSVWDELSVFAAAGANRSLDERDEIDYFEVNGVRFAFLSFTTYSNAAGETNYGLTSYSDDFASKQISEANENADMVIVSMRWGIEYSPGATTAQRDQAKFLTEQGADIILGHGPHVLAPVELIETSNGNKSVVWYSLGNFINAQTEAETLFSGFAVIDIDAEKKEIIDVSYLPFYMHYEWTAEQAANEDLLARDNFEMFIIDDAEEPLKRSQLNTTIEEQLDRIDRTLNLYTEVDVINSQEYFSR